MLSNAIMLNAHTVKIQTSKTCEHVELDDLKDEVKRSVLAAALGSDDPCTSRNAIGGAKGEASNTVGDYYWIVMDNTFYAKKDGAPTTTDYDFYIKFEGKEPTVWVEDAEKWKSRITKKCEATTYGGELPTAIPTCQVDCSPIAELLPDAKEYDQYLLNVKVYGEECEGLQGYGNRTQQILSSLDPMKIVPAYGLTCTTLTTVCDYFAQPGFGIGTAIADAVGCFAAPAITVFSASKSQSFGATNLAKGFLAGTGIGALPQVFATSKGVLMRWQTMRLIEKALPQATSAAELSSQVSRLKTLYEAVAKYAPGSIDSWDQIKQVAELTKSELKALVKLENGKPLTEDELKAAKSAAQKVAEKASEKVEGLQFKQYLKGVGCSILGQVAGSIAAYGVAANNIIFPDEISVNINQIPDVVTVLVNGRNVTVGG